MRFSDRADAGRRLAQRLRRLELDDPVVLGLPRGGVPVASEVAAELGAPLDVLVVRKIGAPFQPELGVGAIAEGGIAYLDGAALGALGLREEDLAPTIERETAELQRRVASYCEGRTRAEVEGRTVVVVDDGLATGVSARAALRAVRARRPERVILAVPVAPPDAEQMMAADADDVVVAETPQRLSSVGQWYDDFSQTADETVNELLDRAGGVGRRG